MLDLPNTGATERAIITAIRELIQGRNNAVGTVANTKSITLDTGSATTVVPSPLFNGNGTAILVPRTATAATEVANGSIYISDVSPGSFTITHANSATADRTYDYFFAGG